MDSKLIIVAIICVIVLASVVLTAMNRKKIAKMIIKKDSQCDYQSTAESIKAFDKESGNQAPVMEEYNNLRRQENRERKQEDPSASNRSDICTTDACQNCDPYNKQLMTICKEECGKDY
tara:strand:+ start:294 stop:650 length:357 start_codon:yes stop_codon:yes gene_type:complete